MAKKQYSSHQKGVIKRYYENRETLSTQKLGEIVSNLYLASPGKKADKLWERAENALHHAGANEVRLKRICDAKDLEALAALVNQLF